MSDIAISVRHLSKQYKLGAKQGGYRTLRDGISDTFAAPFRRLRGTAPKARPAGTFWALKDLNFDIRQGEVAGIIGRNGAGKSTLLKVLSRITEPTEGYADIHGRVGSLLEVGTGFHPELTGRENIYLNGAILGMRRVEIDSKFDEIVAFAEIEQFLDTAVKHYSSGMYLRLAFAVAAHLEPEILLVDEVLAVGDAAFQRKCTGKMSDVARQGRTVLFVSHNMAAVRQLCTSAFLLSGGTVARAGSTEEIIREYLQTTFSDTNSDLTLIRDRKGAGEVRFRSIRFEDEDGMPTSGLVCGKPGRIVLGVSSSRSFRKVRVCVGVMDSLNQRLFYLDSKFVGDELPELPPDGELVCQLPRVHLAPGRYRLEMWLQTASKEQDRLTDAGAVDVEDGNFFGTGRAVAQGFQVALMDYSWSAADARAVESESRLMASSGAA
ncbi:MAG TPA: ABC transporter ATP-binding protein [Bryobacteraceae bacterium]|nr:ABC transporter ATP-binding protein [Bryobacteraceae bacterium]